MVMAVIERGIEQLNLQNDDDGDDYGNNDDGYDNNYENNDENFDWWRSYLGGFEIANGTVGYDEQDVIICRAVFTISRQSWEIY